MNKSLILTATIIFAAVPSLAAPSIAAQGVKNAASFADPRLPSGSIAQGSIFNVFGSAMGPTAIAYASGLPLLTTLSGTSISVTVNDTTGPCYMFYTSAGQVTAILPSALPPEPEPSPSPITDRRAPQRRSPWCRAALPFLASISKETEQA